MEVNERTQFLSSGLTVILGWFAFVSQSAWFLADHFTPLSFQDV